MIKPEELRIGNLVYHESLGEFDVVNILRKVSLWLPCCRSCRGYNQPNGTKTYSAYRRVA